MHLDGQAYFIKKLPVALHSGCVFFFELQHVQSFCGHVFATILVYAIHALSQKQALKEVKFSFTRGGLELMLQTIEITYCKGFRSPSTSTLPLIWRIALVLIPLKDTHITSIMLSDWKQLSEAKVSLIGDTSAEATESTPWPALGVILLRMADEWAMHSLAFIEGKGLRNKSECNPHTHGLFSLRKGVTGLWKPKSAICAQQII